MRKILAFYLCIGVPLIILAIITARGITEDIRHPDISDPYWKAKARKRNK